MKTRSLTVLIHVVAWAIYISLPVLLMQNPEHLPPPKSITHFLSLIIFNVYLIGFFYLNANLLVPRLFTQKKFVAYFSVIIALLVCFSLLPEILRYFSLDPPRPPHPKWREFEHARPPHEGFIIKRYSTVSMFLLVFLLSTLYRVAIEWFKLEKWNREIQAEKLGTELSFLKAQINPHFLFNTLNSLYILSIKKSEKASEAILILSKIMRYVLTEAKNDKVDLDMEIDYIRQYIELQKLRLTDNVHVDFTVLGTISGLKISPLLLIPFVENAFQYGISTHHSSPITIHLEVNRNMMLFVVENRKNNLTERTHKGNGIGIENTRRKLQLLYPDQYTMDVNDDGTTYRVKLTLDFNTTKSLL
jgi:two-component system, LytTR family, sensor kinase